MRETDEKKTAGKEEGGVLAPAAAGVAEEEDAEAPRVFVVSWRS